MSERGVLNTLGTASAVHGRVAESGTRRPPDGMFARFSFLRLPAGRAVPFLDVLDPNGPCRTDAAARADRKPGSLHAPAVRRRQVHIDRSINRSRSLVKRRSRPVEWWPSIDVSVIWGRCRRPSGRQRLAPCARVPEEKTLASGGEPVRNLIGIQDARPRASAKALARGAASSLLLPTLARRRSWGRASAGHSAP